MSEPLDNFSHFDLASLSQADGYKLLASVILPRPIAWVVTRANDKAGNDALNAAPFSFFYIISADPPLVAISFTRAPDREGKDTLAHIRERHEFVVNLVSEELADAMNLTAVNAPRGVDEIKLAGLKVAPSVIVDVPRISASPVALECKLFQVLEPGGSSVIVLGRIVYVHVLTEAFTSLDDLHVDPSKLKLIGRMHGAGGYTTTRDVFTLSRKSWPL
jgi:flavin reductase (DIM6/NTAB) family NADH-FMN oxidoreductase RutF